MQEYILIYVQERKGIFMSKYTRNSNKVKFDKGQAILIFVILAVIIGVILGFLFTRGMDSTTYQNLYNSIQDYFYSFNIRQHNSVFMFMQSFFKYVALVFVIWIFGFIPIGGVFVFILLVFTGIVYGYTTAFFIIVYGPYGIFIASILYLLQFIILVPTYLYMAYNSITYIFYNLSYKKFRYSGFPRYLKRFLIGSFACIIVAYIETFLTPIIIQNLM